MVQHEYESKYEQHEQTRSLSQLTSQTQAYQSLANFGSQIGLNSKQQYQKLLNSSASETGQRLQTFNYLESYPSFASYHGSQLTGTSQPTQFSPNQHLLNNNNITPQTPLNSQQTQLLQSHQNSHHHLHQTQQSQQQNQHPHQQQHHQQQNHQQQQQPLHQTHHQFQAHQPYVATTTAATHSLTTLSNVASFARNTSNLLRGFNVPSVYESFQVSNKNG